MTVMDDQNPQKAIKVLIVEDDPSLSKMYATKFETDGFAVDVARDGAEGLAKTAEFSPDVILLDMMLPKYTGIEFMEQMQQHSNVKNTPIICLTNLTEKKESERASELGAKEYLAKAMHTPEEIVEIVRKYVGNNQEQQPEPQQESTENNSFNSPDIPGSENA